MQMLVQAAQKGHLAARVMLCHDELALAHKGGRNFQQIVTWMTEAAQRGAPEAMSVLASCAMNGYGMPANQQAAMKWLERAAELRDPHAQTILGSCLLLGEFAPRNLSRGINLLRSSMESSGLAQWKLALCYKAGVGVPKDNKECEHLFERAAQDRFPRALPWPFKQKILAFEEALASFRTLASVHNRQAYYWLAICNEDGLGMPQDSKQAAELYHKSAQKGFAPAIEAVNRLKQPTMSS
jgi:TPR repeat protein